MPLVLHTGFDNSLARIKNVLGNASFESVDPEALSKKRLHEADLVLVGPGTENILRTVQAISRADSLVSTIVVPYEKDYAGLKQSLLFTPYVSRNISIFPFMTFCRLKFSMHSFVR